MPFSLISKAVQAVAFVRAHWPQFAVAALASISFVAGRYSAPVSAERQISREGTGTVVAVAARHDETTTVTADKSTRKTVEHTRTTKPNGTVQERWREVDQATNKAGAASVAKSAQAATKAQVRTLETVQVVVHKPPNWRVTAMAGLDFRATGEAHSNVWAYGLHVERRLVGPLSVGAFGLSSGVGGASISLEF